MNIFNRIAIGTAAWGKEYNGAKVSETDIVKILGYAQCNGIDTLDCATAYGWDWTQANSYFNKVVKVREGDDIEKVIETQPYAILAHNIEDYRQGLLKSTQDYGIVMCGASIYTPGEHLSIYGGSIVELPYSLYDRRFEPYLESIHESNEVHVRSIFLRGRIIQDGISAEECIKFVLANPHIDKIIIGADSFDQFRRNLDFVFKWNRLEKHDEELLDPRQWKEKR
jgi:hypothetical protein